MIILKKCSLVCLWAVMISLTVSCGNKFGRMDSINETFFSDVNADVVIRRDPEMIRTSKGASSLDLETPLRCNVNWQTQEMVLSIPYNVRTFNLVKNGNNDIMPRFEVTGFSFETMPAEKALLKLTKEAGIKLVAKDAPYQSISAENLRGEFSEVIGMIADAAEIFYSYDANNKTLHISRRANFSLYVPKSRPITLALLDVLRGAGITDLTTDWDELSITFDADYELRNKVMELVKYFEENPVLVAFDVGVLRVYPFKDSGIEWQELIKTFDFGTVKTAKTGVIGRVLTTSDDLNFANLKAFLEKQAIVVNVAEGKFVAPNLWFSRFDVGKCGNLDELESRMSIIARSSLEQNNKIFSNLSLESTDGQITQFNIRSRLGENFLIIGLPNTIFNEDSQGSETVVFVVPRIVRTAKTSKHLLNKI